MSAAMGRLGYSPETARLADVNDLAAALYQYEESRRELLVGIFGPADGDAPSPAPPDKLPPLTPAGFDALVLPFSSRRRAQT